MDPMRLTTTDHDRDSAGLTYVYPVVSRRARGVSIGINLNPNNACNWRCVYCQVPDLVFGKGPAIDLDRLEQELGGFLHEALHGDWMERVVPEGSRRLNDVAFSGNGESTSSPHFAEAVERVGKVLAAEGVAGQLKVVLITNGSLVHQAPVQRGLARMAELDGEVWFKLDGATDATLARINDNKAGVARSRTNLITASKLCPTWVQTLALDFDGPSLDEAEQEAYCELLAGVLDEGAPLKGVLLYGLSRPSHQPEAARLAPVSDEWLESFAARIRATGLEVRVSP